MPLKKSMFSSTVRSSYRENFCDMYPMVLLISSGWVTMSNPPTVPLPPVGISRPQSMRIVVDLPAPFGPRNPKISPWSDRQVDPVHGHEVAEAAAQALDRDRRSALAHQSSTIEMNTSSSDGIRSLRACTLMPAASSRCTR